MPDFCRPEPGASMRRLASRAVGSALPGGWKWQASSTGGPGGDVWEAHAAASIESADLATCWPFIALAVRDWNIGFL
jgi:hypothetical protein